ncbi:MAG: dihydroorotase [Spirulinaceae cyanobacterium]
MNSELLEQVRVLDPVSGKEAIADVLLVNGIIKAIAPQIQEFPSEAIVTDCQGLILAPGLIDLYSRSGEPGYEERETLLSLAQAATAGGFTQLNILPNTSPPLDNPAELVLLQHKQQAIQSSLIAPVKMNFWGNLTVGGKGEQMSELAKLCAAGVIGFTDATSVRDLALVRRLLEYLQPLDKPVALRAVDAHLQGNGVMREGACSLRYGLPGNPAMAEAAALAALLEVVAAVGTKVHIMAISTARSVELIAEAKKRGVPVTASTSWLHLLLDSQDTQSYHPNLRLEPPLGNPEDRIALIEGVKEGIIEAIAVDHCPYTYEEKTVAFAEAPPGAIGLELMLPLLWEKLVALGILSAIDLWRALTVGPKNCLGQKPSPLTPGTKAELVLFAPQKTWQVDRKNLYSLSSNTPWWEKEVTGRVIKVWN